MSAHRGKTKVCRCGKRIALIDGEWHHVWWKRLDGQYVIHGCRFCVWAGQPPATLLLAGPVEVEGSLSG